MVKRGAAPTTEDIIIQSKTKFPLLSKVRINEQRIFFERKAVEVLKGRGWLRIKSITSRWSELAISNSLKDLQESIEDYFAKFEPIGRISSG